MSMVIFHSEGFGYGRVLVKRKKTAFIESASETARVDSNSALGLGLDVRHRWSCTQVFGQYFPFSRLLILTVQGSDRFGFDVIEDLRKYFRIWVSFPGKDDSLGNGAWKI